MRPAGIIIRAEGIIDCPRCHYGLTITAEVGERRTAVAARCEHCGYIGIDNEAEGGSEFEPRILQECNRCRTRTNRDTADSSRRQGINTPKHRATRERRAAPTARGPLKYLAGFNPHAEAAST